MQVALISNTLYPETAIPSTARISTSSARATELQKRTNPDIAISLFEYPPASAPSPGEVHPAHPEDTVGIGCVYPKSRGQDKKMVWKQVVKKVSKRSKDKRNFN